uniref:Uncharacterized protein n=1 Tax=Zea mays TaxID=4577 RepID=A0A804NA38_MAIZE
MALCARSSSSHALDSRRMDAGSKSAAILCPALGGNKKSRGGLHPAALPAHGHQTAERRPADSRTAKKGAFAPAPARVNPVAIWLSFLLFYL